MKRRQSMGFGWIEAVVTVAIIGILVAIALPSMDSLFGRGRVDGALQEVSAVLNLARTTAVGRSKSVSVMIQPSTVLSQPSDNWCVVAGIPTSVTPVTLDANGFPVIGAASFCKCSADCVSCSDCEVVGKVKASDHNKVRLNATLLGYVIDPANGIVSSLGDIELRSGSRDGKISLNKLGKASICTKGTVAC